MLIVENITAERGNFQLQADFTLIKGTKTAIIGPSGSGKSTLLDVIAGFQSVRAGRVMWERADITNALPGNRPFSLLFQDNNLFPHLTIAQNVGLGFAPSLRLSNIQKDKVAQAMARVGLEGRGGDKPNALSGGQQSRAALARVLLQANPLILLDEPFSALGPAMKHEMLALLDDLLRDLSATLVMVTHDPKDAQALCEQTILVVDGKASPPQDTAQLLASPPDALKDYLGKS